MVNEMVFNEVSYFGAGSREKLVVEIQRRNLKKILVITDQEIVRTRVASLVTENLKTNQIDYVSFDEVRSNPTVSIVKKGVTFAIDNQINGIVAIGGGSAIDTAKAIGIIMNNPEHLDVISLEGEANTKNRSLPIIAIPTTAGTSSEVTKYYCLVDEARAKKIVCVDRNAVPVAAIIDPDLIKTMPEEIAIETGIEAFAQAIEGYLSTKSWQITDVFLLNAISLIYKNLEKTLVEKDQRALESLSCALYMSGIGFSNTGLGIINSMAHSLSAYFDVSHGVASAVLLPHVLRFNSKEDNINLYDNIAEALGLNPLNDEEVVELVVSAIEELTENLGLPQTLEQLNIPQEMIPTMAKQAINDICTKTNLRKVNVEDIISIYNEAY